MTGDAILICALKGESRFADDVPARCADCGAAIAHRPHAIGFAVKVCMACGLKRTAAARAVGEPVTFHATRATLRDVATYFARPKGTA